MPLWDAEGAQLTHGRTTEEAKPRARCEGTAVLLGSAPPAASSCCPCSFLSTSAFLNSLSGAAQRLGTTLGDEHMGPLPQPRGCPITPKRTGLEPACVQDRALTGLQCPSALPRRGKQVLRALHDGHQQEPPQVSRVPALLTALRGPRGPARAGWVTHKWTEPGQSLPHAAQAARAGQSCYS